MASQMRCWLSRRSAIARSVRSIRSDADGTPSARNAACWRCRTSRMQATTEDDVAAIGTDRSVMSRVARSDAASIGVEPIAHAPSSGGRSRASDRYLVVRTSPITGVSTDDEDPMRFIDFFDQGASRNPDAPCFIHDETEQMFTFRHLREITLRTANALRADGFSIGMKGAVLSPNDAVGFACLLGIVRAGMVWVAINPRNALDENCFILDNFECEMLFYHSAFEQAIEAIRKRVPRIRRFVCIDRPGNNAPALLEWVREQPADEIDPGTGPDDLVLLQTTGGTTGVPKGAMHTNRSLEGFFANMYSVFQFEDTPPVYLAAAPITHAG